MMEIPNLYKGLVFTVKGPFAHFRKFYGQTSALSYPFPPRTALCGMVGAILGIPRTEVYEIMQPPNGFFVLQILTPIRKITSSMNLLSTKGEYLSPLIGNRKRGKIEFFDSTKNRTQIPMEILLPRPPEKTLKFRVAFWHKDIKLLEKLKEYLTNTKTFFPVYLGISEFLAVAEFEGETDSLSELQHYKGEVHSVVTSENVEGHLIKPGNRFSIEHMLIYMNSDFSAKAHTNVVYSENSSPLFLKVKYVLNWKENIWVPYELITS
ncbi:type I-B CRISPR-associated protein Cas5b [Thermodesulfatator atlanticus]|uniref:type I-B CRISPR-associated protein Cas5b n=1 Tax=Thermodesulfatator atlanticus TaxID=501497 RepID=UPI0003B55AAA|nr:type I-B CRISPR-associated protein Cas5b [Thermodesulfatator atlanticus]